MATFNTEDTIVARATPPGRGGIGIVRVSGAAVAAIADQVLGQLPSPRHALYAEFKDANGEVIDTGVAVYFPAPNSFTGEAVLELQGHGSPVVIEMLIEHICSLGARLAQPGEFSQRAFLNDKLDLAQAEAIADLIDSASRTAAKAARRSLQGKFSEMVLQLNAEVTALRVHVEATMDFPEEEIDFLGDAALLQRLESVRERFDAVAATVRQGRLLRDGVTIVLAGRPNAGKSSLLNALAGYDAAIVTAIAGTTRDLVREQIEIDGLPLHIIDTAGLRDSVDAVEAEGIRRATRELDTADHALLILDSTTDDAGVLAELVERLPADLAYTVVRNKADLSGETPGVAEGDVITISATTGAGIAALREHLKDVTGYQPESEGSIIARQRHLDSLTQARRYFDAACVVLRDQAAGELMAEELLQVQNSLAEITGQFSSDDLLGEIFASFCIGK